MEKKITIFNNTLEVETKTPIKIMGCVQTGGTYIHKSVDFNNNRAITSSKELKVFKVHGYSNDFDCLILTDNGNLFTAFFNDGFL